MSTCSMRGSAATSWKVAGSIPDDAIGIVDWHRLSDRTMTLGAVSASNRNEYQEYFLEGKCVRCVGLTTLPPSFTTVLKSGSLNLLKASGSLEVCTFTCLIVVSSCHWMARRANCLTLIFTAFPEQETISLRQLLWRNLHLLSQLLRCIMSSLLICVTFIS
jgi:hypothetical protein